MGVDTTPSSCQSVLNNSPLMQRWLAACKSSTHWCNLLAIETTNSRFPGEVRRTRAIISLCGCRRDDSCPHRVSALPIHLLVAAPREMHMPKRSRQAMELAAPEGPEHARTTAPIASGDRYIPVCFSQGFVTTTCVTSMSAATMISDMEWRGKRKNWT